MQTISEEIKFNEDWFSNENYEFKILTMLTTLNKNHFGYCGKLKDMCDFLGVGNTTSNTKKIKEAINNLEKQKKIKVIKQGQEWLLFFSDEERKKPKNIEIQKD